MPAVVVRSLLALCLLFGSIGSAPADDWLAVGSHFPRVFEPGLRANHGGLAVSLLREALEQLGHRVRFQVHPWARAQLMVEQGQADILIGPYKTPEREARFAFSAQPFYRDRVVFYVRRDHYLRWGGDYSKLAGLPVGVVRAWAYGPHFDAARERLELVTVESVENGLRMLSIGRLHLLASNQRNTRPPLRRLGLREEITQLETPIDTQDGYFAFPKLSTHVALRQDLDRVFAQMRESGRLAALAEHYRVATP